jgi:hypothetical protein
MKHETSIALYAYWQSCHGRMGAPAGEVKAVELAPILPSLFLVDLDIAAGLRVRFCGAAMAMRYGRDLADESFLALWEPADRDALKRDLRASVARSSGLVAGIMAETVGGGFTAFEMLLLPLAGDIGAAGAIGSMVRVGGHEEMNRIRARVVTQSLRSVRFLPSQGPLRHPGMPGRKAFPTAIPAQPQRRYGHLTVLSGGR